MEEYSTAVEKTKAHPSGVCMWTVKRDCECECDEGSQIGGVVVVGCCCSCGW